ncbi:MAG: pyridoxamine 5'-phosphate oxidase [Verrucomicrobiota bacterium]
MNLADFRKEYLRGGLRRSDLAIDPVSQFALWFRQATEAGLNEPNAMILATTGADGAPSQRTVLLKSFDSSGFVFFSNYASRKAQDIEHAPIVSLLFPWILLERQVAVQGRTEKTTAAESAAYFASRPRDSQLGAWVSAQSDGIPNRAFLTDKLAALRERFDGAEIPLPPSWGGYRVIPETVEFWQGGAARLHDRFVYRKTAETWDIARLSP